MPSELRSFPAGEVFHVIIRGNNKRAVFRRDCEFRYFKKILLRYKKRFKFLLYHYILMQNHIHLCIETTDATDISKMMQGIQLSYHHYKRKRCSYVGHLWQGRFKSYRIKDDSYLLTVGLYIEKNPVEATLVSDPKKYPWSSYKYYINGEDSQLIDPNPLYEGLGKDVMERQKNYQELMLARLKESQDNKDVQVGVATLYNIKD